MKYEWNLKRMTKSTLCFTGMINHQFSEDEFGQPGFPLHYG